MLGTEREYDPDGPSFELLSQAVRDSFRELIGGRYNQCDLSEALGSAANRLNRFLAGKRGLTVDEALRLLGMTGAAPSLFLQLMLARLPAPSPAETIRQLCLPPDPEPVAFLVELGLLLRGKQGPEPDRGSRLEEIEELDSLRFSGALAVRDQLERVLRQLAAETAAGPNSARARRELIRAIGLWSTISRTLGERAAAAEGYASAFEMAATAEDQEGTALLEKRAAYLLCNAGYGEFALAFIDRAAGFFLLEGDTRRYVRCLVDRGIFLMKMQQDDAAEKVFFRALRHSSELDCLYRASVQQWLSFREANRQNLPAARRYMTQALAEYSEHKDSYFGHLSWSAGRLDLLLGDYAAAEVHFRQALKLMEESGRPFEAERILLDIAETYLQRGLANEVRECGRELLAKIPKHNFSRKATAALIKVSNCLIWRAPSLEDLAEARAILKATGGPVPPPGMTVVPTKLGL